MKYYFNWLELKRDAGSDFAGILVLLKASFMGYNKKIANSGRHLMAQLHLQRIPAIVFRRKFLFVQPTGLYCNYSCRDPQSYFTDDGFITSTHSTVHRGQYLYMLAQRPISVEQNYIPKHYVPERLWNNPFVKTDDKNIHFLTERS